MHILHKRDIMRYMSSEQFKPTTAISGNREVSAQSGGPEVVGAAEARSVAVARSLGGLGFGLGLPETYPLPATVRIGSDGNVYNIPTDAPTGERVGPDGKVYNILPDNKGSHGLNPFTGRRW